MMVRLYIFGFLWIMTSACAQQKMVALVDANDELALTYTSYDYHNIQLKNNSSNVVEVGVQSSTSNELLRGFGLGANSQATLMVEKGNKLVLRNSTDNEIEVAIKSSEGTAPKPLNKNESVNLTFRNNSATSIPLIIPTVMNPNLSPFSNSGITLKMGQEILFKAKGKRYVLFTIDETFEEGEVIQVATLLKARKKELGLR